MKLVQEASVKNKRVFLRTDYNVPIADGKITENYRIKSTISTIRFLLDNKAKIIIGTHLGRPEGQKSAETSLALVAKELEGLLGQPVMLASNVIDEDIKKTAAALLPGQILMLENLRWDPREEKNDPGFAKELASLADVYVNDAFAVSHRANASVEAITQFLPSYSGLLLQSEITNLTLFLMRPNEPFILIIGGAKVEDKTAVLNQLAPKADQVLIGGAVANTFLKANGVDVGESLVDDEMVAECRGMLDNFGLKFTLPEDFVTEPTASGSFKNMDLGPRTVTHFITEIRKAKTVLWNGSLGKSEDPKYQEGMKAIAKAMGELGETTIIAGGDTVGFVLENGLEKGISFLSTGGGAALEYLAGKELPGIKALK